MKRYSLLTAESSFRDLFYDARQGGTVVIFDEGGHEVELVATPKVIPQPLKAGSARGLIKMAEDFDEPLEDFAECEV